MEGPGVETVGVCSSLAGSELGVWSGDRGDGKGESESEPDAGDPASETMTISSGSLILSFSFSFSFSRSFSFSFSFRLEFRGATRGSRCAWTTRQSRRPPPWRDVLGVLRSGIVGNSIVTCFGLWVGSVSASLSRSRRFGYLSKYAIRGEGGGSDTVALGPEPDAEAEPESSWWVFLRRRLRREDPPRSAERGCAGGWLVSRWAGAAVDIMEVEDIELHGY